MNQKLEELIKQVYHQSLVIQKESDKLRELIKQLRIEAKIQERTPRKKL